MLALPRIASLPKNMDAAKLLNSFQPGYAHAQVEPETTKNYKSMS